MSVALEGVSFRYGSHPPVLAGVDLAIQPGEAVAVMGPSGSGKSTLLSVMGLLLAPTEGIVRIDGVPAPTAERHRRTLRSTWFAWVFQATNLLPRRSARDNVALGVLGQGSTRPTAEAEAGAALATVGLAHLADRVVEELSGGERQRVGIARACVQRPRLVLADEPTGQLDAGTSRLVIDSLLSLAADDTALLVATHDPAVATRCSRVLRIIDGRAVT